MNGNIDISFFGLAWSLAFVLLAGLASLRLRLGLGRDLAWGTLRTVAQLALMGYVLRYVFAIDRWYLVLALYAAMIFVGTWIARGRVKERRVPLLLPVFVSMLLSNMVVTVVVTAVIVRVQPWYDPRYFIPLGGMVIGNSFSAVAVSLDRFLGDLRRRRDEVELFLCLGADSREASEELFRGAVKAGMIPSITAMMGVGIVWIPGMMTGQILAGADPFAAMKYQIMVMLMLVAATAIGSMLAVTFVRRRCFSPDHRVTLR
jgi:putative ABC transport system permease protein